MRIYHLLLWAAIVLFGVSFLVPDQKLDVHLHDTYYVISASFIFWVLTIVSLLMWVFYMLTANILRSIFLTSLHVIATLALMICFVVLMYRSDLLIDQHPRRYFDYTAWELSVMNDDYSKMMMTFIALILSQFIYVINLVIGLIKRRKSAVVQVR